MISSKVNLLVEGMRLQTKLYEEWLTVMADYATVFSLDRHRGDMDAATASEDTRGHNSSLVCSSHLDNALSQLMLWHGFLSLGVCGKCEGLALPSEVH